MSIRHIEICSCPCHQSGVAIEHAVACCSPCEFCGENILDLFAQRHFAECPARSPWHRRQAFEMAIIGSESPYLTKLLSCAEYRAELLVIFEDNPSGLRQFVACLAQQDQVEAEIMRLIAETAKDTALIAAVRSQPTPLILRR